MTVIHAIEHGVIPNKDVTRELIGLLSYAGKLDGEKRVVFEKGTYFIDSEKCEKHMLYITNTVGDGEFARGETPHLNAVPFYIGNTVDLVLDGNGSTFIINGKVTNIAIENCKNITVQNLEIRHAHPDMHEFKVIGKTLFTVDFEIDRDSLYEFENGHLVFTGNGYRSRADKNAATASWIGLIREETPDKINRVRHPLFSALKVVDLGNGKIRVRYPNTSRFKTGDRYYVYDVRRQFAGIFINKSENTTLINVKQRFNYSLALVMQDSGNLTVDGVEFAPEEGSARKMTSAADFFQICMCRGKAVIKNSFFGGAGDDLLNIHGIHFKIVKIDNNSLTVRFMHPQTHGFNPLRVGDSIAYIDPETLLETGSAVIESSEMLNENDILLTVTSTEGAQIGDAIEDTSACAQLEFVNNSSTRIITRGLLITTRAKAVVENNRFKSTSMSGILLSDDAKNWYESGMCRDVTIKDNIFDYCGETPILIKPENSRHAGAVHKNIKIVGNTFKSYPGEIISAKSSDGITVSGNRFCCSDKVKTENCLDVVTDC